MKKTAPRTRSLRAVERPAPRPHLRAVPPETNEEEAVVALLSRIRPRPRPWTPPPAA